MYEIKIKNCNIMKLHVDVFHFQASLSPHKLSVPAQLVFIHKVTFIRLKSMSLFGDAKQSTMFYLFLKTAHTNKWSFECPTSFSHLWLITSPTDQPNLATVYWYPLPFTGTATVVKYFATVYNSTDQHGESFTFQTFGTSALSQPKRGIEACRNDCIQA